jgi:hypothetical protein
VLVDDTELQFSTTSGKLYTFEMFMDFDSTVDNTGNIKVACGNATDGYFYYVGLGIGGSTASGAQGTVVTVPLAFRAGTVHHILTFRGSFIGDGSTFKIRWAQNSSSGNRTRVYAGSILRYQKLN